MMLHKPLVSLVLAFAAASSVTASATQVRRRGYGGFPTIPASQCNTHSLQCCSELKSTDDPNVAATVLNTFGSVVGPGVGVGLHCVPIVGSINCNNNPACCQGVYQVGIINVGCSPVDLGQ
ncbi:hypothetical protein BJV78DRAFT_756609 [Lactifluus subvellereus]|nr:hypothetical protein BJV78DRAFT_756609 [Lactifluus subvellereus]